MMAVSSASRKQIKKTVVMMSYFVTRKHEGKSLPGTAKTLGAMLTKAAEESRETVSGKQPRWSDWGA